MVHRNIPGERDGKIIAQGPFRNSFVGFSIEYRIKVLQGCSSFVGMIQSIVQDLEDQFITLFPILPIRVSVFSMAGVSKGSNP